jgi:hypothetical protein
MPSVSLHIGVPKTATSYIQSWLHQNRFLLREHGVFVPDKPIHAHRLAVEVLSGAPWDNRPDVIEIRRTPIEEAQEGFLKAVAARKSKTTVISSEYFYYCDPAAVAPAMRALFGPDLDVVVYIRSQCELILSGYNQDVKRLGKTSSRPKPAYHKLYDWRLLLDDWSKHFGKSHIKAISFDRSAENRSLLSDFVAAACPIVSEQFAAGVFEDAPIQNESLPADLLEFKRVANALGDSTLYDYEWLEAALRAGYKGPRFGVSAEEAAAWNAFYAESNEYVAREYFGAAAANEIFQTNPPRVQGVDLEGQLSLDTVAKLLAFVARRNDESRKELMKRIKALEAQMGNLGKRLKELGTKKITN